ncbi:MAG: hypothetical protein LBT16_06995, partial [Treponema sp.]|nr:hypothetical protein [Treponema sp.]
MKYFNRKPMRYFPLGERKNKVDIRRDAVEPMEGGEPIPEPLQEAAVRIGEEIIAAKKAGRSIILAFGAHVIKNGLGLLLGEFIKRRWLSHLATNGAGIIHDWEFAYQGLSSEDVRANVREGKFGTWEETGFTLNTVLALGAFEGLGYGEAVGALIVNQGFSVPSRETLGGLLTAPL